MKMIIRDADPSMQVCRVLPMSPHMEFERIPKVWWIESAKKKRLGWRSVWVGRCRGRLAPIKPAIDLDKPDLQGALEIS